MKRASHGKLSSFLISCFTRWPALSSTGAYPLLNTSSLVSSMQKRLTASATVFHSTPPHHACFPHSTNLLLAATSEGKDTKKTAKTRKVVKKKPSNGGEKKKKKREKKPKKQKKLKRLSSLNRAFEISFIAEVSHDRTCKSIRQLWRRYYDKYPFPTMIPVELLGKTTTVTPSSSSTSTQSSSVLEVDNNPEGISLLNNTSSLQSDGTSSVAPFTDEGEHSLNGAIRPPQKEDEIVSSSAPAEENNNAALSSALIEQNESAMDASASLLLEDETFMSYPVKANLWSGLLITETQASEIQKYWKIMGVDEVGFGALAGPIVVCAAYVNLKLENLLQEEFLDLLNIPFEVNVRKIAVRDSKKLNPSQIDATYDVIMEYVKRDLIMLEVCAVPPEDIESRGGSHEALRWAQYEVVSALESRLLDKLYEDILSAEQNLPEQKRFININTEDVEFEKQRVREAKLLPSLLVLVDGGTVPQTIIERYLPLPLQAFSRRHRRAHWGGLASDAPSRLQQIPKMIRTTLCNARPVEKGDAHSFTIAVASIVAKKTQQRIMQQLAKENPSFRFDQHLGYGTQAHSEELRKYGPTVVHRLSSLPVWDSYRKWSKELSQEMESLHQGKRGRGEGENKLEISKRHQDIIARLSKLELRYNKANDVVYGRHFVEDADQREGDETSTPSTPS